jgi:hypothetical protein
MRFFPPKLAFAPVVAVPLSSAASIRDHVQRDNGQDYRGGRGGQRDYQDGEVTPDCR